MLIDGRDDGAKARDVEDYTYVYDELFAEAERRYLADRRFIRRLVFGICVVGFVCVTTAVWMNL